MSTDCQGTKCRRNIAENLNRLSRVHERYRQTDDRQTDGRAIAYIEREREFTFAKNAQFQGCSGRWLVDSRGKVSRIQGMEVLM